MIFLFWEHILFTEREQVYVAIYRVRVRMKQIWHLKNNILEKTESDCTKNQRTKLCGI